MAIVYVSEQLSTAVVFGEGFAEDVVFEGIPMRRVSLEWLAWLRKNHKGTKEDAERLAELLRQYQQDERHSQASSTPGECYVDWEDPDCGAESVVATGSGEASVVLRKDGQDADKKRRDNVLPLWEQVEDNSGSAR